MTDQMLMAIAVIAVVIVVAVVAWFALQRRRSERLRQQFGPEYERTVGSAPDRRRAEADLEARRQRVEALEIRPLDPGARDAFAERWRVVQAMFVDDPSGAVNEADTLIGEVMRARGYPVGDFEQRAADVSVNHPRVVDHYRTAHAIAGRSHTGAGQTEELRQAFVHYRALFAELLELPDAARTTTTSAIAPTDERAANAEGKRVETTSEPAMPASSTPTATEASTQQQTARPVGDEPAEPARRT